MLRRNDYHGVIWPCAPVTALLLLAVISTAGAQERYRGTADDQQACIDDVNRLCSQFIPDEQRIVACLAANRRNLSPACRAVFSRTREDRR